MASGLHWTEAQLRDAQARRGVSAGAPPPHLPLVKGALKPRKMNKAEAQYDAILRANKDVVWSGFEVITLRLADDTRYTPDFEIGRAHV